MNANGGVAKEDAKLNRDLKDSQREVKKLEKELQRKEKALAEAAALAFQNLVKDWELQSEPIIVGLS